MRQDHVSAIRRGPIQKGTTVKLPAGVHALLGCLFALLAFAELARTFYAVALVWGALALLQGAFAKAIYKRAKAAGNNPWWGRRPGKWV
jgi:uncharacterized membrane protein HdeD (DUF308 family)